MRSSLLPQLGLAFVAIGASWLAHSATRIPLVLDVPAVRDVVVDRFGVLYASTDAGVRRYDLRTRAELAPLELPGADARALALDASGCRLAIADVSGVQQGVWVLDALDRRGARKLLFPETTFQGGVGSFSVIWAGPDELLTSSLNSGTQQGPVRRTHVGSGAVTEVRDARYRAMLAGSADGRRWAMVESTLASGPVQLHDVAARAPLAAASTGFAGYEVAISRDGAIVAVPTYAGTFVFDAVDGQLVRRHALLGAYSDYGPIGMVFSPHTDASFVAVGGWDPPDRGVFVYPDASFGAPLKLDAAQFTWANQALEFGRTRIAADGRTLLVTQTDRVLVYDVAEWGADPDAIFADGSECSSPR